MTIEPATPGDAEAIREVARAAWRADYPVTRETAEATVEEWYDPERTREAVAADDALVLVARPASDDAATDADDPDDAGDRDATTSAVLGFAHAVLGPDEDEAAILRVYVHPKSRRTALGTALVEATVERLQAEGAERIEAMALAANDAGNAFYRSLGFVLDRTEETTIGGEGYEECVYLHSGG